MGVPVLVLGYSGTGKSASLRNLSKDDVLVINVANKPLPFKNKFETFTPRESQAYRDIIKAMDNTKKKVIVVDDAQYIMSFQYMRRIQEKGWDKWNDIQGDFFNVINHVKSMDDDKIVYFLSHLERDQDGYEKIKTMGKMLDEKITIEGLFTIVLKTNVADGQYTFLTQNSGRDTVKSPIGMFPSYAIENDIKYVDEKIRNYYEIGEHLSDDEMAQRDEAVKRDEIEKPSTDGRKRKRKSSKNDSNKDEEAQSIETTQDEKKSRRRKKIEESEQGETQAPLAETGKDDVSFEEKEEAPKRKRRAKAEVDPKPLDEGSDEVPKRRRRKCGE